MLDNRGSMRRFLLIITGIVLVTTGLAGFAGAQSASLSERQIEIIRANCPTAQTHLQQVQRSDVTTRISRGRDYEQLLRLMATFNSRVVLNKLDASTLSSATADFEKQFRAFQRDYIAYNEQLSTTVNMRCSDQPVTFYDALTLTRQYRARLATEIKTINELLDAYEKGLTELRKEVVQPVTEEGSQL